MKKLINAPAEVLADALKGVAAAHPELAVDFANRVVSAMRHEFGGHAQKPAP